MTEGEALRWSAYEHEHFERDADWYWALGIAAAAIAITSVLLSDVLFGILILAAASTIALLAREAPELARIEISERGIRINDTLHRFGEILSFWVEDEHPGARPLLLVDTTKFLSPNLIIPIEGVEPRAVRAYMRAHAKERHMREPVAHKILEFFGL